MSCNYTHKEMETLALLGDSLIIYKNLRHKEVFLSLQDLLHTFADGQSTTQKIIKSYHNFCALAVENKWPACMADFILEDDNFFTRQAATAGPEGISRKVKDLAARDLVILQELATVGSSLFKHAAVKLFEHILPPQDPIHEELQPGPGSPATYSGQYPYDPLAPSTWPEWEKNSAEESASDSSQPDAGTADAWLQTRREKIKNLLLQAASWADVVEPLAGYFHQVGYGLFSSYPSFRWQRGAEGGSLQGISRPDPIRLGQLIGLSAEHELILENTERFLAGHPASNMLLYGDRGSGKSSTVKAQAHTYMGQGLRLVELAKPDLGDLPAVMRLLAEYQHKFIIFIDDLSFEETEQEYKTLKAVLEGGLEVKPDNVLIYVTSNRHHLIKETFSERRGDEVHAGDSMQEKLSLADRFGLTVIFSTPDQKGYLHIVDQLAARLDLPIEQNELHRLALHWEMWHNGRSGRTARQFVDHLAAGLQMSSQNNIL